MERCTNHTIATWGSDHRQYFVSVKDISPTCSCPRFLMARALFKSKTEGELVSDFLPSTIPWCSHIEAQVNKICSWIGEDTIIGRCPRCGSPTEPYES